MAALKKRDAQGSEPDVLGEIAGEYRILKKLGVGGFGAVYEAEHPVLKRRAAVKVLHALPGVDAVAVQRFIEEARSASRIRHRHIIDIFSFGQLRNGQYFYVMDLLEGAPLDVYLKQQGKLAPELALQILRPIASALDALHAASLVHRDVKPANIFLAFEEETHEVVPKLLDLGLVKLLGTPSVNTASGVPMGTPYYMSPEQCRGDKVDARADIYSFGIVCHECLTGQRPFVGDSSTAVLVAHLTRPPPSMSGAAPELPPALDEPVLRMLAKDPAARPSSAGAALEDLERAAREAGLTPREGLPWLPRPASQPASETLGMAATVGESGMREGPRAAEPTPRRARFIFGVIASLLLVALAGSYWLASQRRPGESQTAAPAPVRTTEPSAPSRANETAGTMAPPRTEPAPEAPPPAKAEPTPVAARQVALVIRGAPAGAAVLLGDRKLGEAPGPILLPYGEQPLELSVTAPGYGPKTLRVTPSAPLDVALPIDKTARTKSKRGALPHDLENPF